MARAVAARGALPWKDCTGPAILASPHGEQRRPELRRGRSYSARRPCSGFADWSARQDPSPCGFPNPAGAVTSRLRPPQHPAEAAVSGWFAGTAPGPSGAMWSRSHAPGAGWV